VKKLLTLLAAVCVAVTAHADTINGAGATFPAPVYAKWAAEYNKQTGVQLNYQAIGSGGGIKQIDAKTVDFGATDDPRKAADLEAKNQVQFATVKGGVVAVTWLARAKNLRTQ
jgi:phosphate transport system substrate-binding protein